MTCPAAPADYEVRVDGHLDGHWAAWLGDLEVTHQPDGTTTLRAVVRDQAELHGLLARIRDLGVPLVSVVPLDPTPVHHPPTEPEEEPCPSPPPRSLRPPTSCP